MALGMTALSGARPLGVAGSIPSKPEPFNMTKHRQWFGKVCGANGTAVKERIRRMEA